MAVVVHNTTDGTVLLVRQFRYSTHEKGPGWMLELPAGVIGADRAPEEPEETVYREVLEETGFSVRDPQFIGSYYLSPSGSSECIHLYYCRVMATDRLDPGGGLEEEGEDIEIIEVPTADLLAKLDGGFVVDAKSAIGLYWRSTGCDSHSTLYSDDKLRIFTAKRQYSVTVLQ